MKPGGLRLEHGPRLLGVTEAEPRMSWLLPDGATRQEAYRLEVGEWDSGRVEGDRSTYVAYEGVALQSRQQVTWRVKVWTDLGETDWSDAAGWEMGLLHPRDWRAQFVSPVELEPAPAAPRPAYALRRSFELTGTPSRSRVYATAHGVYELFVNDVRVGDLELTPGFTAYRSHLEVQTYDVDALLGEGVNTIEAILSDGWYRGQVGFGRDHDSYGSRVALLLQLEVALEDGSQLVIGTDENWASAPSGIFTDLIEGQREDHRATSAPWSAVEVVDHDLDRLTASPAPPTRRIEELEPVAITDLGGSTTVVDFGQNSNGWVRLHGLGPAASTVRLTHGERLRPDGTVDMEHLRPFDFATREPLSAGQVDEVVASGVEGEVFEPRHTTHGFQFAQIEGRPGAIATEHIRSVVVHTDLRRTGWFTCSDGAAHEHPTARYLTGSSGWGDAAVLVPWEMWVAYGDERFLERGYQAATRWVEFAARRAREGRHKTRVDRLPQPHETYLWDSGFHWGEWCEPGGNAEGIFTQETDVADVATAFLHRSASILARTAGVLGRHGDADRWAELAANAASAWRTEFIDADGSIRPDTQANLVRALAFGLVPEELRPQAAARLVELIRANVTHLSTGFLATPYLLPVLADTGHADVAFELLFQDTVPSWLAMIDAGANTIWENWEGVDDDGLGSLNHYSKGAVVTFLHRYVAGIRPDEDFPGYRRFRIEPVLGGGLTSANATLDGPYGRIESSWTRSGNDFDLRVTVPPGTDATVVLPSGTEHAIGPGTAAFTCP